MKPTEIVSKYMASFYGQIPLKEMKGLLSADLDFKGPFFSFNSGTKYYNSLAKNPIKNATYKIIHKFVNDGTVCLIYKFKKNDIEEMMAQYFEITENKITKIRLIFDSDKFRQ
jgi:hypothetical protein